MLYKKSHRNVEYVCGMFSRISWAYNFMNRLISLGRDISWRRFLISLADVPKGGRMIDVGTGTGDIAFEALRVDPSVHMTGLDFALKMIEIGRKREGSARIGWCLADALRLPFPDATFDAVTSGFLVRNVVDARSAFIEQVRVVKPGGRVVCLDTSPAPRNILRPFALFYLKILIPLLGCLITGEREIYLYLHESTLNFMEPKALVDIMKGAGLVDVAFRRFMFGNIAVHWGMRPVSHPTIL
jgi:demethylmenaquinone methyltransferase/2-methoxy-6-polyprenyl-1,4-benzoquinol methylase